MQLWTAPHKTEFRLLQTAYREAWHRFSLQVNCWRFLIEAKAEEAAIRQAEYEVARAEAAYRESRDRLASYMLADPAVGPLAYTAPAREVTSPTCLTGTC
jgi:hypothetical protein